MRIELFFQNNRGNTLYTIVNHQLYNYELYELIEDFPDSFRYPAQAGLSWIYSMSTHTKLYPNNELVTDTSFYYLTDRDPAPARVPSEPELIIYDHYFPNPDPDPESDPESEQEQEQEVELSTTSRTSSTTTTSPPSNGYSSIWNIFRSK